MSLRAIAAVALAATALSGAASADDYYRCGEQLCYDDQADETRRLNEMQLDDPGAGIDAVPPPSYDDRDEYDPDADEGTNGQGGPYDPRDDADEPGRNDAEPYDDRPDSPDSSGAGEAYPPDDDAAAGDDQQDCDPQAVCDPDAYPDEPDPEGREN